MISTLCRFAPATFAALLLSSPGLAQQPLPPQPIPQQQQAPQQSPSQNPACQRLETQLGAFDRSGGADAGRVKQLEDQLNRQQNELDRKVVDARRANCEGGFFLFQGPQCSALNSQVQSMRDGLDRTQQELSRLQNTGPNPERDAQRRAILVALSQNDCGQQYRQAVATQPAPSRGGLFETLFGANSSVFQPGSGDGPNTPAGPAGTYKTLCVRTCDGFYYPISYASNPNKFADDARACQQSCPAAEAQLYAHRPEEGINQATNTITQQPYTALPTAFKYRQAFDNACSCKAAGQTWSQALKGVEDQVESGDVVVTPERARQLSQPRFDAQGKPIRQAPERANTRTVDPKTGRPAPSAPTPVAAQPMAPVPPGADDTPDKPDPKRSVRNVGPTFIPAR